MKAIGCALVAIGLIAVVVVAAGTGTRVDGSGTGDGTGTIVLEDFRITPNRIDAKVGVPLTARLTNKGTERDDLNFESIHMPGLGGVESILEPGATRTITLSFDQPGTRTFICTVPRQAAAGVTGAAFVTP